MPTVHVFGNLLIIFMAGAVGWFLSRRKGTALLGIGLSAVLCTLAVLLVVRPGFVVKPIPYGFSDLAFYANCYPVTIALFVPCTFAFVKTRRQQVRMAVWCTLLFILSFKPYDYQFYPLATSSMTMIDGDGVCRQSRDYTCSAASLVTYLRLHDVSVTEAEAIEMARTKAGHGTTSLGLYRALRIQQEHVGNYRATIDYMTTAELLDSNEAAIILVGLPTRGRSRVAVAFGRDNDWPTGIYHDVVFMGTDPQRDGRVLIADPDMGLESWPIDHLEYLFRGVAVMYEAD
jgi:predicted double-glycine peptidase